MAIETDWPLVLATAVLVGATIVLAYHTKRLWTVTKQVGEESDALAVKPILTMDPVSPFNDGNVPKLRYPVRNVGKGNALNPSVKAFAGNSVVDVEISSRENYIDLSHPFMFNLKKADIENDLVIEIEFTDMRGKKLTQKFDKFTMAW